MKKIKTDAENTREKLIKEIESKTKELEQLDLKEKLGEKKSAIKELSEFTDKEKCKYFDKFYKSASNNLERYIETKFEKSEEEHYSWEEHMSILSRDNKLFWNYYNSINK